MGVAAMINNQLGEVATLSTRTNGYVGTITGLRFTEIGSTLIRISWDSVPRATGYKITWHNSDGKQEMRSLCEQMNIFRPRVLLFFLFFLSILSFLPTGAEDSQIISASLTSYTISGLQQGSAYRVSVSALIGSREGPAATQNTRTGTNTHNSYYTSQ